MQPDFSTMDSSSTGVINDAFTCPDAFSTFKGVLLLDLQVITNIFRDDVVQLD